MFWPEKAIWVMGDEWLVKIKIASVLELLTCRKFSFIQTSISSSQMFKDDEDSEAACGIGIGSVFIYHCVSSA